MSWIFPLLAALIAGGILLFVLDDLHLDLQALFRRLGPGKLTETELSAMAAMPRKRIAILVANWKEEEVLEFMVRGNSENILYQEYSFFLGVYPNDLPTWQAARRLEQEFPHVFVVVNPLPGPTSKGQLLNEMFRQIVKAERITGLKHDLFVLQDSEDMIHPLALQLMNREAEHSDFIQIPVFSLPARALKPVAGVYMDEFAESHTKDMLVRAALGAPVPSAGVGTALSSRLVRELMAFQSGDVLNEACLTEDYQLGLQAAGLGFRTTFSCFYREKGKEKDFIATREYFPDSWKASVRQKTRWTIGIAFQSADSFGWPGNLLHRYFLWRDRRGPWNGILITASFLLALAFLTDWMISASLPSPGPLFRSLLLLNGASVLVRIAQRMRAVTRVYGLSEGLLVPLRWPVGNAVNAWAAWRAFRIYRKSLRTGEKPRWVKTQHRLPDSFGRSREKKEERVEVHA